MATKINRSEGIGDVVVAALFGKAIRASTEAVEALLKEAKLEQISKAGLVKLVVAAYEAPFMSEDMREEIYSSLVRELQPMAKQENFSIGDVRLFWPKLVAKMRAKGMQLPDFSDPKIQGIVRDVVQTLHGSHGQGAGKHVEDVNQQANEWLGRMNSPGPAPMPGPVAR